jgi:hypothetical protein
MHKTPSKKFDSVEWSCTGIVHDPTDPQLPRVSFLQKGFIFSLTSPTHLTFPLVTCTCLGSSSKWFMDTIPWQWRNSWKISCFFFSRDLKIRAPEGIW